ncbi:MAG: DinB family protein [Thermomicrobiales bacterium]
MTSAITRPAADEFNDYYAGYINLVPDGDIMEILTTSLTEVEKLLGGLSEVQANFRFAPGEWTIKEVAGHLVDAERAFGYRAFAFSRNESAALPGFEQDDYVREGNFDARSLGDLLEELSLLRRANLIAFRYITPEASLRDGIASNNPVTVRALVYILAGHTLYHLADLHEKYLAGLDAR